MVNININWGQHIAIEAYINRLTGFKTNLPSYVPNELYDLRESKIG